MPSEINRQMYDVEPSPAPAVRAAMGGSPCGSEAERDAVASAAASLRSRGIDCTVNEPMSRHTTYRVGGPAALMVVPDTEDALVEVLTVLANHHAPTVVVGGGSNLLVADEGVCAAVITLGGGFRQLEVDGTRITVGGACSLAKVVAAARDHGLTGLEFCAGVPGTVGGAVAMNAGSRDRWIGSVVRSVTYVTLPVADGAALPEVGRCVGSAVEWGYRSSDLRDRTVVCEVTMELSPGSAEEISGVMAAAMELRRKTQPLAMPNAGSVFKNPEGDSAGRLIEASGLKGYRIGDAEVSPVHANFIVAGPDATARDIYMLVNHVQGKVVDRFGVKLTPEIRFIGRF